VENLNADFVLQHVESDERKIVSLHPKSRKDLELGLAAGLHHPSVEVVLFRFVWRVYRLLILVVVFVKCIDNACKAQWVRNLQTFVQLSAPPLKLLVNLNFEEN
jgi:hypothetical protein